MILSGDTFEATLALSLDVSHKNITVKTSVEASLLNSASEPQSKSVLFAGEVFKGQVVVYRYVRYLFDYVDGRVTLSFNCSLTFKPWKQSRSNRRTTVNYPNGTRLYTYY